MVRPLQVTVIRKASRGARPHRSQFWWRHLALLSNANEQPLRSREGLFWTLSVCFLKRTGLHDIRVGGAKKWAKITQEKGFPTVNLTSMKSAMKYTWWRVVLETALLPYLLVRESCSSNRYWHHNFECMTPTPSARDQIHPEEKAGSSSNLHSVPAFLRCCILPMQSHSPRGYSRAFMCFIFVINLCSFKMACNEFSEWNPNI